MIGSLIGRYKLIRLIGEGGMASVYEGEHETLGTKVAIKILNPILSANQQIRQRFKNEAKMMATLDHPNIICVLDYEESDTFLAITMEMLRGKDMNDHIKEHGKLSVERSNEVFSQVLSAFNYAHNQGIVHRDVKPANIFLLPDGQVKILDFGIAKLFGLGNEMTQTGTQMGTPMYMSPEQVKADKSIDHRSDIFSLGVTLYFSLTGKAPYESAEESSYEIFTKIVNEPIPTFEGNPIFDAIIQKAAAKDRNVRYQSVEEMQKDLNALYSIHGDKVSTKQGAIDDNLEEKLTNNIENKEKHQQKPPVFSQQSKSASAALIFGIIGLFFSWLPLLNLIMGITAIVLGVKGQKDQNGNTSTNNYSGNAGIILGGLTVLISLFIITLIIKLMENPVASSKLLIKLIFLIQEKFF